MKITGVELILINFVYFMTLIAIFSYKIEKKNEENVKSIEKIINDDMKEE